MRNSLLTVLLMALALQAQQPGLPQPRLSMNPQQLDNLVAPIALYPDPLLSQILVASTYPLELVKASQWTQQHSNLSGAALTQAAEQEDWDPSVQALVLFPDLLRRLNQDITWTTNLGNAFLNQEGEVMDAVQRMRAQAQQSGKLASTNQQTVTMSNEQMIEIQPADAYMMYVPDYDPSSIWGPPLYYPYPGWRYPRFSSGIFFNFGLGIQMGAYLGAGWGGWSGWGWQPQWRQRDIIVNNNFLYRHSFNSNHNERSTGMNPWTHDASHRQGVPYATPGLTERFTGGARRNVQPRSPQTGGERMGNRQVPPSMQNRGTPNVFGGLREGGAARQQSDHGYSTLGPARTGQPSREQRQQQQQPNRGAQPPPQQQQQRDAPNRSTGGGAQPNRGGGPGGGRPEKKN